MFSVSISEKEISECLFGNPGEYLRSHIFMISIRTLITFTKGALKYNVPSHITIFSSFCFNLVGLSTFLKRKLKCGTFIYIPQIFSCFYNPQLKVISTILSKLFLQKRERGKLRIHRLQNVQYALDYLKNDLKVSSHKTHKILSFISSLFIFNFI